MNRKVSVSCARHVVYKVFAVCMAEFQTGKLLCDLDDVYVQTAILTGVSEGTVRSIVEEAQRRGVFQSVTSQEWKNCVDHVIKIENEYFSRGETLYINIDKLVITVGDDSSSESEEVELDQPIFGAGMPVLEARHSPLPVLGTHHHRRHARFRGSNT